MSPALLAQAPAVPALQGVRPEQAAAGLRHLPGLLFLDSAVAGPYGRTSLLAARPARWFTGRLTPDGGALREAWEAQQGGGGLLAGAVEYEGRFHFGHYPEVLLFEHETGIWREIGGLSAERAAGEPAGEPEAALRFQPELTAAEYEAMVARAQEWIAAGDIYQVNLAHRFRAGALRDPWGFYRALRECSPAPQAAFLRLPEQTLLSASPELFLEFREGWVRTRPIKGTRPRGAAEEEDQRSAAELAASAKERAELVMITDLLRNDLGQVCRYGSVRVPELAVMEPFAQVFHLVSTVEGHLRPEVTPPEALAACFPGGSITGAPKRRAREIIAALEPGPRGFYTGALGWLDGAGNGQFSIAIRTVVAEREQTHFHVGAGIVADSDPAQEWAETWHKARGMLQAAEDHARGGPNLR